MRALLPAQRARAYGPRLPAGCLSPLHALGARAKAAALLREFPQLLQSVRLGDEEMNGGRHARRRSDDFVEGNRSAETLDISALMRASNAISSEIEPDRVLGHIMKIMVTNAGAQRGFLLLHHNGQLVIRAKFTVDPDIVDASLYRCRWSAAVSCHAASPTMSPAPARWWCWGTL